MDQMGIISILVGMLENKKIKWSVKHLDESLACVVVHKG